MIRVLASFCLISTPFGPLLRAHLVALVWWGALFESVTQKAIRPAAAPINTFAAYCDRDDLNVCKRARENGDIARRFTIRHADVSLLFVHRAMSGDKEHAVISPQQLDEGCPLVKAPLPKQAHPACPLLLHNH